MTNNTTERANFGSKLGVILATAGSAVGLGNVWRFPYMAGENGGAVFIIIYVGCVILLGIPCMISEFIVGRHGHCNTARAFSALAGPRSPWAIIGYMSVLTGFLITGYYAVVSGWCLQYVWASLIGHLQGDPEYFRTYFAELSGDPVKPVLWTFIILGVTYLIIEHGVRDGIERASKLLMPTLFILLLVIVVAACLLPGGSKGVEFLFKPDFTKITSDVFLGALGQSFYSLSIAMGCLCTYASYFSRSTDITKSAAQIAIIDCLVAILAGLMIFPAAFSVGVSPDSGPSLIFITLPNVFAQAFSAVPQVGYAISIMFYALLVFAALTSTISMHEIGTAFFTEEFRLPRRKSAWIITVVASVLCLFCSWSVGAYDIQVVGLSLMDFCDQLTANFMLPLGGMLTCLFVGWYIPRQVVFDEFTNDGRHNRAFFRIFLFAVRYVCPLAIALVFLHQVGIV